MCILKFDDGPVQFIKRLRSISVSGYVYSHYEDCHFLGQVKWSTSDSHNSQFLAVLSSGWKVEQSKFKPPTPLTAQQRIPVGSKYGATVQLNGKVLDRVVEPCFREDIQTTVSDLGYNLVYLSSQHTL